MNMKNMENINVYNYGSSDIIISTRDKQYTLPAAINGTPSMLPLTPNEVEYFNGNSPAIRLGLVRFSKEIEQDIYNALRITNWEDILFEDAIEDIILNPTLEKLQKIVAVKSVAVIERVRGILTALKNTGTYDISTRVDKLINARYNEISRGKVKTDIVLSPRDVAVPSEVVEDVTGLKAENEAMKDKLASMEAMIAELMKNKNGKTANESDTGSEKVEPKKPGRPPKTDK